MKWLTDFITLIVSMIFALLMFIIQGIVNIFESFFSLF